MSDAQENLCIICYELGDPRRQPDMVTVLHSIEKAHPILNCAWAVRTTKTAAQLSDMFSELVGKNGSLFIGHIHTGASFRQPIPDSLLRKFLDG